MAQATAEGERDAANTARDEAQDDRDAALIAQTMAESERDDAMEAKTTAEEALTAAQADVTKYMNMANMLQATLGEEMDPAPDSIRGMLAAAQADVTKYMNMANMLQATLGEEMDPAPDSIRGMLAAAQADVTKYMNMANMLQETLGDEMDPAAESVRGMLAQAEEDRDTYMNMANMLQMTLGEEMNPAADSVRGMLAQAQADLDQAEEDRKQAVIDHQNAVIAAVAAALGESKATVAYDAYTTAKTMLNNAYMAYDADPSVENAKAYEMAAGAAKTAADIALTAAQDGGTEAQMTAAQSAVGGADDAVLMAAKSVAEANRVKGITDDALQHAMVIPGVMGYSTPETAPFNDNTNTNNYSLTITHTGDGVKVAISDPGDGTAVTVDKEPGSAPYLARGWHGSMHERTTNDRDTEDDTSDDVTEKFIVYTDIDRAGEEAYGTYYSQSAAEDKVGVAGANSDGVLTLTVTADTDGPADIMEAADLGRYASPSFPIGSGRIITYREDPDDDPDTMDSERTFDGMFHGISGEYTCAPIGTGLCQAFTDDDGMLAGLVGTWTFEPEEVETGDPAHMVADAIPDADHMRFGYWLQTTRPDPEEDTDDPKTTYMIQAFVGGADEFLMSSAIVGTAEYKGRAAGVYVRKEVKRGGDIASATAGEFHAKASLTAYFGGDSVAVSNQYRLKGTVDEFQDSTTGMALAGWAVNLEGADPDPASLFGANSSSVPATNGVAMTRTVGDTAGSTGTWTAQFFGPHEDADNAPILPSGVAGEFNAHWTNGHAVGAFGAEKMAE
jgi:hypothetical protein